MVLFKILVVVAMVIILTIVTGSIKMQFVRLIINMQTARLHDRKPVSKKYMVFKTITLEESAIFTIRQRYRIVDFCFGAFILSKMYASKNSLLLIFYFAPAYLKTQCQF